MHYGDTWYVELLEAAVSPEGHGRDCIPADSRDVALLETTPARSGDGLHRLADLLQAGRQRQLQLDSSYS